MTQPTSPVLLTLYTLVVQHGPVQREDLTVRLARQPLADLVDKFGKAVTPTPHWVSKSLYYLQSVGRVRRQNPRYGAVLWVAVPQAEIDATPVKPRKRAVEAAPEPAGPVVQPARVDMFGPPWKPPKDNPGRPGARDYESLPSLHQGRRCAWRSGLAAPG